MISNFQHNPLAQVLPGLSPLALQAEATSDQHNYVRFLQDHVKPEAWHHWYNVLRDLPSCNPTLGPWIAGGAIRRLFMNDQTPGGDIDYFCKDKQQHHLTCARLEGLDAEKIQETKHHITYKVQGQTIQVIRSRFCDTLEKHLNEFDFCICQTGWDGQSFILSILAFKDLMSRELNVTGVYHNPMDTLRRVVKYYRHGFVPTKACITGILDAGKEYFDKTDNYS